jgi:DNA polymerase
MARKPAISAADFLPRPLPDGSFSLGQLRDAAAGCRGCDLYKTGTQTVFGEGPVPAGLMLVGEQPGDQEDRQGRPFVGPAGRVLDEALAAAGIDRGGVYLTNAVKHFKWTARGKRRLHAKPSAREAAACRPWLEAEMATVRPRIIVCMGATAAASLLGPAFRLTRHRGEFMEGTGWAALVTATIHPSAVLRMPDEAARRAAMAGLVEDLRGVAVRLGRAGEGRVAGREAGSRPARAAEMPRGRRRAPGGTRAPG